MPPNTGIVHQVNLEFLGARGRDAATAAAFPDTLVGTDSHTTMVNGLGVLGWGVGGIEAEAAMLGEAISMLVPQVVGFKLTGELPEGATATDLVLTVTQILRRAGVVGKFVEYFGRGPRRAAARRPRDDREHVPRVRRDVRVLPGGRGDARVPAPDRPQRGAHRARRGLLPGADLLFHDPSDEPTYSQVVELDLGDVEPSLAGPRRPQDRVPLSAAKTSFLAALESFGVEYASGHDEEVAETFPASDPTRRAGARQTAETPDRSPPCATSRSRARRAACP